MPPALHRFVSLFTLGLTLFAPFAVRAADASYLFSAARAFEEGRYEDALTELAQATRPNDEVRYLNARAQAALSRYAQALDTFSEAPPGFPSGVRDDFASLRAQWAADAGRCDDLLRFSTALEADRRARLNAECTFRAGDYEKAAEWLASARDVEGRSLYAQALAKLGDATQAAERARALWIEAPAHRDADLWKELARKHPAGFDLDADQRIARAEAWLSAHRAQEAIEELEGVPDTGSDEFRARLWHLRGDAFFKARGRYPEAAKAFEQATALAGPTEAYDAFHAVRSLSRAGDDREAIKRYEKFAKAYPKSALAGDALYLAGWLGAREKLPNADRKLQQFVASSAAKAQPGLQRDALWDLAWLKIQGNKPKEALRWLDKIPDDRRPAVNAQRSYWRASSLLASGEQDAGKQAMRETLWVDPLGWYAQLSARRLMALGEPAPPAHPEGVTEPSPRPTLQVPDDVRFYRRLGLNADATTAAERWTAGMKDKLTVVAAHQESGDAVSSHASAEPLLASLLRGPPTPDNQWLWRAVFPLPYERLVRNETRERELPSPLFYGHMQVESRYKPAVVSGADAIGLMQLLPSTAKSVARGRGLTVDRQSLKRPAVNVPLGASYLSGLVKRYAGQYPPAIAAYNAGTQRVDGWLQAGRCPCPLDRWVEEIPVEQTRNYVRRVVSAWARYRYIEAPDEPWGVDLPSDVRLPTK